MNRFLFLLAFLVLAPAVAAQSLVGSWHEAATGLTYEFAADGSGSLVQGATAQPFAYALDGSTLVVQMNGSSLAFSVQELAASRATFALPNGTTFTLTREGAAPGSADGVTEADVMAAVRLVEFVTGEALASREVDGIRREVHADFASDPAASAEAIAMFRSVLQAAAQATDPVAVGMARQQLLVGLLDMRRQTPGDSPFFDAITDRVRLVAFDPATQTGATDRDVEAALAYLGWLAEVSGGQTPSRQARREYETYVAQHFASLPQADKEFLSAAAVIWPLVQVQWAALSMQQQTMAQQQMVAQPIQWQADAQSAEQYYATMSEISAMSHRTSMNILGNIGDGGSQYEMWNTDEYGNPTYQIY